jgi:NHLM bacteriocin system ABC transporter peptidase/ATP-binding protein
VYATPTILQLSKVEGPAAALSMILAYHGRWESLGQLMVDCDAGRAGATLELLEVTSKLYGLEGSPQEVPDRKSLERMDGPAIILWKGGRFLIYEGQSAGRIRVNDPAVGRRWIRAAEFDEGFQNQALLLKPGPDFTKGGVKPNILFALSYRLRGYRRSLVFGLLAGLLAVIPGSMTAVFSTIFVDYVLVRGFSYWTVPLVACMLVTCSILVGLNWLQNNSLLRVLFRFTCEQAALFTRHLYLLPVSFHKQRVPGELNNRVDLNMQVAMVLTQNLGLAIIGGISSIFYGLFMALYSWKLAVIVAGVALLNAVILKLFNTTRSNEGKRMSQVNGLQQGKLVYGLDEMERLKLGSSEQDWVTDWSTLQVQTATFRQSLSVQTRYVSSFSWFIQMLLIYVVILGFGGYQVIQGELTFGGLVALQTLGALMLAPLGAMVALGQSLQLLKAFLMRLDDVWAQRISPRFWNDLNPEKQPTDSPSASQRLRGEIELRNVTFGYARALDPLFKDLSLKVKPGGRVALVGVSGAGKTTVGNLVTGLYDAWSGEVLIDGKPIDSYGHAKLTSNIARVNQTVRLFEGTVNENINMFSSSISDRSIRNAVADAHLTDLLSKRPAGIHTEVYPRGANFSCGQQQQIEIARALSSDPAIVILDEATSTLDSVTERKIDENIRGRGCTCLIMAHRLSTVQDADEIIVLDHGSVAERGTHSELLALDGLYTKMVSAQ